MNNKYLATFTIIALLLMGSIYFVKGEGFQDNPKYDAAMSLLKDKKFKETKQLLSEMEKNYKQSAEFDILYMKVCLIDQDFEKASEIGERANEKYENNSVVKKLYGEALIGMEEYLDAEAVLKEAYDEEAIDLEVLQLLTKTNFLVRDYEDTISYADKVLAVSKTDFFANVYKGYSCLATKNYDDALQSFDTAIKVYPKSKIAHKGKLQAELALGKKKITDNFTPDIDISCGHPVKRGERQ